MLSFFCAVAQGKTGMPRPRGHYADFALLWLLGLYFQAVKTDITNELFWCFATACSVWFYQPKTKVTHSWWKNATCLHFEPFWVRTIALRKFLAWARIRVAELLCCQSTALCISQRLQWKGMAMTLGPIQLQWLRGWGNYANLHSGSLHTIPKVIAWWLNGSVCSWNRLCDPQLGRCQAPSLRITVG